MYASFAIVRASAGVSGAGAEFAGLSDTDRSSSRAWTSSFIMSLLIGGPLGSEAGSRSERILGAAKGAGNDGLAGGDMHSGYSWHAL